MNHNNDNGEKIMEFQKKYCLIHISGSNALGQFPKTMTKT